MKWLYMLLRRLLTLLGLGLVGALVSGTLVRLAPGYGVDERELDPTWSAQSLQALRHEREHSEGLLAFYARYLSGAIHGNLGKSESLGRPVSELLRERFPVTSPCRAPPSSRFRRHRCCCFSAALPRCPESLGANLRAAARARGARARIEWRRNSSSAYSANCRAAASRSLGSFLQHGLWCRNPNRSTV